MSAGLVSSEVSLWLVGGSLLPVSSCGLPSVSYILISSCPHKPYWNRAHQLTLFKDCFLIQLRSRVWRWLGHQYRNFGGHSSVHNNHDRFYAVGLTIESILFIDHLYSEESTRLISISLSQNQWPRCHILTKQVKSVSLING